MQKRIHDLKIGDKVRFSNCEWVIVKNATYSRGHDMHTGVPPVAVAKAVCTKGMKGHFYEGYEYTFQGNVYHELMDII